MKNKVFLRITSIFLVVVLLILPAACTQKPINEIDNGNDSVTTPPANEVENGEALENESYNENKNNLNDNPTPSNPSENKDDKPETAITPGTTTQPNTTSEPEIVPEPEPTGINKLRPDYDLGSNRNLKGDITAVVFYLDDFESSWKESERNHFTEKEIKPGLEFLEKSAKKYNVDLNIEIAEVHSSIYYDNEVEISIKQSGYATIDTLRIAAQALGFKDDLDLVAKYKEKYGTEILCFVVFNKKGTSYALNPKRESGINIAEHNLIFAYDLDSTGGEPVGWQSSVIAHETLHLYGAEDFYSPAERKPIAKKYYPNDIMLSCEYYLFLNSLGDATAFYIGWTDVAPPMLYEENW